MPRKSGHTCNADLTIIQHGGRCPDLSGPANALRIGHETKKTSPYSIPYSVSQEHFVWSLTMLHAAHSIQHILFQTRSTFKTSFIFFIFEMMFFN